MGLLAECALAAGFGGGECRDSRGGSNAIPGGDIGEPDGARIAESDAASRGESVATPGDEPRSDLGTEPRVESGTRAERYQVMVHCDAATLAEEGEPGRSDLDGIRVSAETSRRMACDAAVVAMVHAKDGSVLNVGRRTRTIPPHIRRALEERDRGCRFPGCACRFTEAHHVKHWADGGETSLRNTVLLCRRHHRTVHEGAGQGGHEPQTGRCCSSRAKGECWPMHRRGRDGRMHPTGEFRRMLRMSERGRTHQDEGCGRFPAYPQSRWPLAPPCPTGPRSTATQLSRGRSKPLPGMPWRSLWTPTRRSLDAGDITGQHCQPKRPV